MTKPEVKKEKKETVSPVQEAPVTLDPKEIVTFTIANLTDVTSTGKRIPEMEFHYRPPGAPADELPKKYRVFFGGKPNKAPREVVEHLKSRKYDVYKDYKNPETGDVYPVKSGEEPRFMVSEIG